MREFSILELKKVKLFDNFDYKLTKRQKIIKIKKQIVKILQSIGIKK